MHKKIISLLIILCGSIAVAKGQSFNFELNGNPVDTTGWNMSDDSYIDNDQIVLTDPLGNQAGYIYYRQPQNLANCSQFTVSFDFKISNSSNPPADGIAFWYITNPPSSFVNGGGIGLPSNPNGLVLILDTYNNNGLPDDNPLISLRRLDGTSDYLEGSITGQLTNDLTNQNFIIDGNWHTCELKYFFGTVTVSFDGNPPIMTGLTTLNINGYFGFSAGTGALWSKHAIKNVTVSGAPEPDPPATDTVYYCQYDTPDSLIAQPDSNLLWYNTPTGGLPLSGAPTPATDVPGTYTWYVAQEIPGCNIESSRAPAVVVVHPLPATPVISIPEYCSGQVGIAIQNPTGMQVKWYESDSGGSGSTTPPNITTDTAGVFTWYVTQTDVHGCESPRDSVDIVIHQTPKVDFDFDLGLGCAGDTVFFHNETEYADRYLWRLDVANLTDTATNPQFLYTDEGSYFVTLIAKNTYCTDSVIKQVSLGHPLEANFISSADTICQGSTVDFTNQSTATTVNGMDPEYQWDFGDGSASNLESPSFTFNNSGVYAVRLVVSNAVPCYDTMIRLITVDSVSGLAVKVSDTPICEGDEIVFKPVYSDNGLVQTIWNFGDSPDLINNEGAISHAYDKAGIYEVSVSNHYRVCPDTAIAFSVKVDDMPYINIGADTTLCLDGDPFVLKDAINENNPLARWNWNTGDTTSFLTIRHPGHYWAKVTIAQCSMTDEINVEKDCYLDIPNTFTPNGDGVNDYFLPRQLLSKGVVSFRMSIFSRWGEQLFETTKKDGRGWDGRFNGKEQPVGVYVYLIDVIYKNGRTESYKGNLTLLR